MSECMLNFCEFDCIGFDLDHTLASYKLENVVELEYNILAKLMLNRAFPAKELSLDFDKDFLMKGLILDDDNGNVVKVAHDGTVLKATHGTCILSDEEINSYYPDRQWRSIRSFLNNPFEPTNETQQSFYHLSDYFDMPASLVYARAVDGLDYNSDVDFKKETRRKGYNILHILKQCLDEMYSVTDFSNPESEYIKYLKRNPTKYYQKTAYIITWLKQLRRRGKKVFLITNAPMSLASFTAQNTLGPDWNLYFDIIIANARKPFFFTNPNQKFVSSLNNQSFNKFATNLIHRGHWYTQGNWNTLYKYLKVLSKKKLPKCLFVGDNMLQDICSVHSYTDCYTLSICKELDLQAHPSDIDEPESLFLKSLTWGSYLFSEQFQKDTFAGYMLKNKSNFCMPSLNVVSKIEVNHKFYAPLL